MLNCARIQICKKPPGKRSTTRQLLDVAPNLAVPRQDGGKQMLFETSYGVRRCLEPSLRCFSLRCVFSPYKFPIQKTGALEAMRASRTCGLGGARAHLTRAGRLVPSYALHVITRAPFELCPHFKSLSSVARRELSIDLTWLAHRPEAQNPPL